MIEKCSANQWLLDIYIYIFFFTVVDRTSDNREVFRFSLLYYSILKSAFNNNLILVTLPEGVHRHFKKMYAAEKKNFYKKFTNIKYIALALKP